MAAEPATGIIVRASDWSETSRIVTLFTREWGRVRALAKGGRRLKSSFEAGLDLLTVCRVMVIRKSGLALLTEAQVVQRFTILRRRLEALHVGYYIAELLAEGTLDFDPHPRLYDAAVAALQALESGTPPLLIASRFELAWLQELGYRPQLEGCVVCQGEIPHGAVFSPSAGGIVCERCRTQAGSGVWLQPSGLHLLRQWVRAAEDPASFATAEPTGTAAPAAAVKPAVPTEVRQALSLAVCHVLGRRPRLLRYIDHYERQ